MGMADFLKNQTESGFSLGKADGTEKETKSRYQTADREGL